MIRSFEGFSRITANPRVMAGKPCIRGMRFPVSTNSEELAGGASVEELLREFPYLERKDVLEAMRYGASLASEREIVIENVARGPRSMMLSFQYASSSEPESRLRSTGERDG